MGRKEAAQRRAAEKRVKRTKRPKPQATPPGLIPREDKRLNDVALILALAQRPPMSRCMARVPSVVSGSASPWCRLWTWSL